MKKRILFLTLILVLVLSACTAQPLDGELHVTVIDTGNSDCSVIQMPSGEIMMIDAASSGDFSRIQTFLAANDIYQIDYLILTHPHSDHIGGAAKVLKNCDVKRVYLTDMQYNSSSYENMIEAIDKYNPEVIYPSPDDTIQINDVTVKFFAPLQSYDEINNNSIVLQIRYGKTAFLFTGDIEKAATEDICYEYGSELRSDFIKVPHHGSKNANFDTLLSFVRPEVAAITCKKDNDYNHPSESILEALEQASVSIFRTDVDGNISVSSNGAEISFEEN